MAKREEPTPQWSKEKDRHHNGQKDKQRSTTHKTKDRVTRTSLKNRE